MKTIWKFSIPGTLDDDVNIAISMPDGAEILTLQMQDGKPVLWAIVDPYAPHERRYFKVVGTGQKHEQPLTWFTKSAYVATVQERHLVWHIFEVKE